jgi:glycerol-3-phosphate dehydrogenase (NAD(P)+)
MSGAYQKIGVIGAGAWGTALAQVAARAGRRVNLWAREAEVVAAIQTDNENKLFLPGAPLSPEIRATTDLDQAAQADALLLVAPAQHLRAVLGALKPSLRPGQPLVLCAKGIEQGTGLLLSEIVEAEVPGQPLAVLSGPTFAIEVARGLPTAITLACADEAIGRGLIQALGQPTFRPYWSADVIGAEVGGAVKNVLAIACGIVAGRGLGENAKASLITRGLAEMLRFGRAKRAEETTLMGLCGLGDLILTCSSPQSRNMSLGLAVGHGQRARDVLAGRRAVTEGASTAPILVETARRVGVEMPICEAVQAILSDQLTVGAALEGLLSRPFRSERV